MKELVASLNKLKIFGHRVILLGIHDDKDAKKMIKAAKQWATHFVLTKWSSIKSFPPEKLREFLGEFHGDVIDARTLQEGITESLSIAGSTGCLVVAGSLYLVGEARGLLLNCHNDLWGEDDRTRREQDRK